MTDQALREKLESFTRLFQNVAVARDYVTGTMTDDDINELASHLFFVDSEYKYDINKTPIDNVFSAYRIAVSKLLTQYGDTRERLGRRSELLEAGNAAVDAESTAMMDWIDHRLAELKEE